MLYSNYILIYFLSIFILSTYRKLIVKDLTGIIRNTAGLTAEVTDQFYELGIENRVVVKSTFFEVQCMNLLWKSETAIVENEVEALFYSLKGIYLDGFSNMERFAIAQFY